jgi:hypothetical protein
MGWGGWNCGCCPIVTENDTGFYELAFASIGGGCRLTTSNIDQLLPCATLAMIGTSNACSQWTQFLPVVENFVTWLKVGGKRLYIAGEFTTCLTAEGYTVTNNFLSAVGSTMSLSPATCDYYCGDGNVGLMGAPTNVQIMQGLGGVVHNACCEVLGGTAICMTTQTAQNAYGSCYPAFSFISGEFVYDKSIVVLAGDCNIANGTGVTCNPANNFTFFNRLLTLPINNIL